MGHVQTLAVTLTRRAERLLVGAVQATPDDRLAWQPLDQGHSILQQVNSCALANLTWAQILKDRVYSRLPHAFADVAELGITTRETALARLRDTTDLLVAAIEAVDDDEVARMLSVPSEDGVDLTLAEACLHAYWNMVYHEGRIRYIQTLYGDMTPSSALSDPVAAP